MHWLPSSKRTACNIWAGAWMHACIHSCMYRISPLNRHKSDIMYAYQSIGKYRNTSIANNNSNSRSSSSSNERIFSIFLTFIGIYGLFWFRFLILFSDQLIFLLNAFSHAILSYIFFVFCGWTFNPYKSSREIIPSICMLHRKFDNAKQPNQNRSERERAKCEDRKKGTIWFMDVEDLAAFDGYPFSLSRH